MQTFTQQRFAEIMRLTSPHSLFHNVKALCDMEGLPVSSELHSIRDLGLDLEDASPKVNQHLNRLFALIDNMPEGEARDIIEFTCLLAVSVQFRVAAARLGFPMEDGQDAFIASLLSNELPEVAVATMLKGLSSSPEDMK